MFLEALVFALLATALFGPQRFRHLGEAQGAIPLGLFAPIEILLFFQLLQSGCEVDRGKILVCRVVLPSRA